MLRRSRGGCISCASTDADFRRCTREFLCARCRSLPEYRIMTSYEVKKKTGLSEADFFYLRIGTIANPIYVAYRRVNVYYWKDIAELCLRKGLDIP